MTAALLTATAVAGAMASLVVNRANTWAIRPADQTAPNTPLRCRQRARPSLMVVATPITPAFVAAARRFDTTWPLPAYFIFLAGLTALR